MTCPSCGIDDSRVIDNRRCKGEVVRRRVCKNCGHRFSTAERITAEYMQVRKRDGSVEAFNRAKLRKGIIKAAGGHRLLPTEANVYVERVVQILQPEAPNVPVQSSHIGDLVLQQLHNDGLTEVVRTRYAMVLLGRTSAGRGFRTIEDFLTWLKDEYGEPGVAKPSVTPSVVIKRDGKREPFQVEKLAKSIGIAAKGRGSDAEVRALASHVADAAQKELRGHTLVTSGQVAAEVMRILREREQLAHLRYASAVKRYQSVDDFWTDAVGMLT